MFSSQSSFEIKLNISDNIHPSVSVSILPSLYVNIVPCMYISSIVCKMYDRLNRFKNEVCCSNVLFRNGILAVCECTSDSRESS